MNEREEKLRHKQRTLAQNRALHLWCKQVGEFMNDAGLDVKKLLSSRHNSKVISYLDETKKMLEKITEGGPTLNITSGAICKINKCKGLLESASEIEIPWDKDGRMVKELIWKPVMEAMTAKESTTDMDTTDPGEVCKIITKHIGEKFGLVLPVWPDRWSQINRGE
jgi:hypothetical protein